MKTLYEALVDDNIRVHWRFLFKSNNARPRAIHTTWLVCHGKIGTKDKLVRIGLIHETKCNLCNEVDEKLDHLFFECAVSKGIWQHVLQWKEIQHDLQCWSAEKVWILEQVANKGWRASLLKLSIMETIYACGNIYEYM
ncbi:unnamed protein product [Lathyrus sativus]|nr:unnamed protein product [Lathyrus sativus]